MAPENGRRPPPHKAGSDPPVAEQLISPNALRQRRFRERQKALRDDAAALRGDNVTPPDDEAEGVP
jgi:hypothetical protein